MQNNVLLTKSRVELEDNSIWPISKQGKSLGKAQVDDPCW